MKRVWVCTCFLFLLLSAAVAAAPPGVPLSAASESATTPPPSAPVPPPAPAGGVTDGIPYREAPGFPGRIRVLVAHSLRGNLMDAFGHMDSYISSVALVDTFDLESGTPTFAQLTSYDVVVVAPDYLLADRAALGDRLADYVDAGGRVLLTLGTWIPGWDVSGRFASGGYHPFAVADTLSSIPKSLGALDLDHPLANGLTDLSVTLSSNPTPVPGTYVPVRWNDGSPAVAVKGNVLAVNAHPRYGYFSGQVVPLLANCLYFLMEPRLRVLLAPADGYPSSLAAELVKDPAIGTVDYLDTQTATPSLAQLSRYDAVVTWPNGSYLNRTVFGDTLADYADRGGKVVLGGFCWYTHGNSLGGRILTGGLAPLETTTGFNHYAPANLGAYLGGHPLLAGVTAVGSRYRDYTALAPGATWVADWEDGEKFLAFKGNVLAVNGGLMDIGFTGDMPRIVRNAVKFLSLVNIMDVGASPTAGSAPFTTTFHSSATGGQPPYTYRWEFGDGTSSTDQNPSHTYGAAGTYLVEFFVTDRAGHGSASGFYVTVTPPLTLSASRTPASGTAPLAVSFSSTPSGGTPPFTFDWNWGDGSAHGTTQNPSHTFAAGGTYTTILTVTDAAGHSAQQTLVTTVAPALQAFAAGAPPSGSIPLSVTFFAFATGGTPPYTYAWNFGDGATATGSSASHTYGTAGSYSATVTVTDGASRTATSAPVPITATVPPPVVASMVKKSPPFKIVVNGSNLQSGIQVYINGANWAGVSWKSTSKIVLTGSTLKTVVPPGTPTTFRFVNPDGGETTLVWQY